MSECSMIPDTDDFIFSENDFVVEIGPFEVIKGSVFDRLLPKLGSADKGKWDAISDTSPE